MKIYSTEELELWSIENLETASSSACSYSGCSLSFDISMHIILYTCIHISIFQ